MIKAYSYLEAVELIIEAQTNDEVKTVANCILETKKQYSLRELSLLRRLVEIKAESILFKELDDFFRGLSSF
jgi:hypothetical protein